MIRNLKALGLALMALCAFGAVMASGASAQQGVLTSDGPVTLTGEEVGGETENRLTAFGGYVQCPGSTYTGHKYNVTPHELILSGETTVTLTPQYKGGTEEPVNCTGPLGLSATVHMNGCDYVAHLGATTPVENNEGTYGVTFDVVCPPNQEITVTLWKSETEHTEKPETPFCDLHVADEHKEERGEEKVTPTNQGLKGAHATDEDNGHIRLSGTVEEVAVTRTLTHGDPGLFCSNTSTTAAKFDLNVTVSGHDGEEPPKEAAISISEE